MKRLKHLLIKKIKRLEGEVEIDELKHKLVSAREGNKGGIVRKIRKKELELKGKLRTPEENMNLLLLNSEFDNIEIDFTD